MHTVFGVDEKRRLKCNAHIFGIDYALQNVFKSYEEKVGREVLVVGEMGHKVLHGTSTIIMLGLIALCKCLSLSHAVLEYYLYILII